MKVDMTKQKQHRLQAKDNFTDFFEIAMLLKTPAGDIHAPEFDVKPGPGLSHAKKCGISAMLPYLTAPTIHFWVLC